MSRDLLELNGIVIKVNPCRENDILLDILSDERGRIFVFVKNAAKKVKNLTFASPFAYSRFELNRSSSGLLVYAGSTLHDYFPELRTDVVKMTVGQYFCEIATSVPEKIDDPQVFLSLLLNSLYVLSGRAGPIETKHIKLVYEIAFLHLFGFMPDSSICASCDATPCFWHFDEGFLCEKCASRYPEHELYRVNDTILSCVSHILSTSGGKRYAFKMSEDSFRALQWLSEEYIQYKLERKFKTLAIYRELIYEKP